MRDARYGQAAPAAKSRARTRALGGRAPRSSARSVWKRVVCPHPQRALPSPPLVSGGPRPGTRWPPSSTPLEEA